MTLKFEAVDAEELKDLEIKVDGSLASYKIGDGDTNHYKIASDKTFWESQFNIISKNGRFFIRDLGIVHPSRIKLDSQTEF